MAVYLRNVRTNEVRAVEEQSDEFHDLLSEVYDPGDGTARPAWEQQGHHSAWSDPTPEGQVARSIAPLGPDPHPERSLTEGEREAGLKDWKQKEKELDAVSEEPELLDPQKAPRRAAVPAGRRREGKGDSTAGINDETPKSERKGAVGKGSDVKGSTV